MSDAPRRHYGVGHEALLEAAITVVAENGLRGLTYRAVAARAGVNNSLVAHHFGNREGLIEAALDWATERTLELFSESASESSDEVFAEDIVTRLAGADPALQLFQYELLLESRRVPQLRAAVHRQYDAYISAWEGALSERGFVRPDRGLARAVAAAIDGLLLQRLTIADEQEITAAVQRLREVLLSAR